MWIDGPAPISVLQWGWAVPYDSGMDQANQRWMWKAQQIRSDILKGGIGSSALNALTDSTV